MIATETTRPANWEIDNHHAYLGRYHEPRVQVGLQDDLTLYRTGRESIVLKADELDGAIDLLSKARDFVRQLREGKVAA